MVHSDKGEFLLDQRHVHLANIAHLVHEVLLDVQLCRQALQQRGFAPSVRCVIPEHTEPWVQTALEFLGIDVLPCGTAIRGRFVSITRGRRTGLIERAFAPLAVDGASRQAHSQRIFITRTGSRRIVNEEELWPILAARGFTRVSFERIPLEEQKRLIVDANTIVAIHGAALGWLCFRAARPVDWQLVEIFSPGFTLVRGYREHAAVLHGRWAGVRGRITPSACRDTDWRGKPHARAFDDFLVDPLCLERALNLVELAIDPRDYEARHDDVPS
jgi:hypothetical protein